MMPKRRHGFLGDIMLQLIEDDHDAFSAIRAEGTVIQRPLSGMRRGARRCEASTQGSEPQQPQRRKPRSVWLFKAKSMCLEPQASADFEGGASTAAGRTARRFSTSETVAGGMRSGTPRPVARLQAPSGTIAARTTYVVPATAHLDHDPTHNRSGNLAALCQRCHIMHDGEEHRRRRWLTHRMRRAPGYLFTGPYR